MSDDNNLIKLITDFEGLKTCPYLCPARKLTIGYGHLIAQDEMIGIHNSHKFFYYLRQIITKYTNINDINHCLELQFKNSITITEAQKILQIDLAKISVFVDKIILVPLKSYQKQAIISFIFNIGGAAFKKSTMLLHINNSDFKSASNEFMRWVYAAKTFSRGLYNRRKAEQNLFKGLL